MPQLDYVIVLLEYADLSIMLTFKKIIRETSEYPVVMCNISKKIIGIAMISAYCIELHYQ